ncbi:hypothetical protein Krac_8540 [Ktedonobacter racemifer DSM 44963]|uniref:Uncharacterized protein n=1 Tax=Ktedonobacter racemifer DSM 44963 TaxID=485913 RepID=D6TN61_KTERA|nr:hypothetical protein Krac_8540 [Ktedonobacter racemifer DSM 44963]
MGNVVRDDRGYVLYSLEPLESKHLLGQHNQAAHGNRRQFKPTQGADTLQGKLSTLRPAGQEWLSKLTTEEKSALDTPHTRGGR